MRLHVPPRALLLALAATMLAALPACDGTKNDDDDDYEAPRYAAPLASKGGASSMNRMLATVRARQPGTTMSPPPRRPATCPPASAWRSQASARWASTT